MKKIIIPILTILLLFLVIFYYGNNDQTKIIEKSLIPFSEIKLTVPEPSGLFFDDLTNTLWTVSDENSTVYNIDTTGNVINKILVNGKDLEGISMQSDSILVTILERERSVVFINKSGKEKNRVQLDLEGEPNKGIEGISFNSNNAHYFVINEKQPGLLLEIGIQGKIIKKNKLNLASDYSGLFYDNGNDELWIISDEEHSIYKCNTEGSLIEKYIVEIEQIEGIAIDRKNEILYLVSDPEEKLYKFYLP